jgi:hydroxymethylpyrimidine/phosphomethylpyrimidine kinase
VQGHRRTARVLTIAGSDSGGGAGIQADLKAFARCGVHGMSAITAITAQNTIGVSAIHPVPPEIVLAQVRAVLADIGVDAVKVGMLGTAPVTHAVASALRELPPGTPVVVDPVMVAESGARLLDVDAQRALVQEILPLATVVTPNVPEALVLAGRAGAGDVSGDRAPDRGASERVAVPVRRTRADGHDLADGGDDYGDDYDYGDYGADRDDAAAAEALARAVLALGSGSVVLTGGHSRPRAHTRVWAAKKDIDTPPAGDHADPGTEPATIDLFVAPDTPAVQIPGPRHPDGASHGSGCTHASVLAAQLALGCTPLQAARIARELAGEAVAQGLRDVGAGAGPVDVIGLARMRADGGGGR